LQRLLRTEGSSQIIRSPFASGARSKATEPSGRVAAIAPKAAVMAMRIMAPKM
jgi:hypothetical protein